jgi:hypothetical protein
MQINFDPQRYGALRTDGQGRVTFPTLIPGATYHLVAGENLGTANKEFTARAGQTVDLGDVAMKRTVTQKRALLNHAYCEIRQPRQRCDFASHSFSCS